MLGHFVLSQDFFCTLLGVFAQVLGHFVLSQDFSLKCCDTSYCPKTPRTSVGTLRTVPRPLAQVLGHFAMSQDLPHKDWDTSHCPKTPLTKIETVGSVVPRCWDSRISCFLVLGQSGLLFLSVGALRSLSPVPPLEL